MKLKHIIISVFIGISLLFAVAFFFNEVNAVCYVSIGRASISYYGSAGTTTVNCIELDNLDKLVANRETKYENLIQAKEAFDFALGEYHKSVELIELYTRGL